MTKKTPSKALEKAPADEGKKAEGEEKAQCPVVSTRTKRAQKTQNKILTLVGTGATNEEIAKILGISTKTVQRTLKNVQVDISEVEEAEKEYRSQTRKRVPIKKRVDIMASIAEKFKTNPFAALRALQRIDDIEGLAPEVKGGAEPVVHQPLFVLPAGTRVQVSLTPPAQRSIEAPVIDVTPRDAAAGNGAK